MATGPPPVPRKSLREARYVQDAPRQPLRPPPRPPPRDMYRQPLASTPTAVTTVPPERKLQRHPTNPRARKARPAQQVSKPRRDRQRKRQGYCFRFFPLMAVTPKAPQAVEQLIPLKLQATMNRFSIDTVTTMASSRRSSSRPPTSLYSRGSLPPPTNPRAYRGMSSLSATSVYSRPGSVQTQGSIYSRPGSRLTLGSAYSRPDSMQKPSSSIYAKTRPNSKPRVSFTSPPPSSSWNQNPVSAKPSWGSWGAKPERPQNPVSAYDRPQTQQTVGLVYQEPTRTHPSFYPRPDTQQTLPFVYPRPPSTQTPPFAAPRLQPSPLARPETQQTLPFLYPRPMSQHTEASTRPTSKQTVAFVYSEPPPPQPNHGSFYSRPASGQTIPFAFQRPASTQSQASSYLPPKHDSNSFLSSYLAPTKDEQAPRPPQVPPKDARRSGLGGSGGDWEPPTHDQPPTWVPRKSLMMPPKRSSTNPPPGMPMSKFAMPMITELDTESQPATPQAAAEPEMSLTDYIPFTMTSQTSQYSTHSSWAPPEHRQSQMSSANNLDAYQDRMSLLPPPDMSRWMQRQSQGPSGSESVVAEDRMSLLPPNPMVKSVGSIYGSPQPAMDVPRASDRTSLRPPPLAQPWTPHRHRSTVTMDVTSDIDPDRTSLRPPPAQQRTPLIRRSQLMTNSVFDDDLPEIPDQPHRATPQPAQEVPLREPTLPVLVDAAPPAPLMNTFSSPHRRSRQSLHSDFVEDLPPQPITAFKNLISQAPMSLGSSPDAYGQAAMEAGMSPFSPIQHSQKTLAHANFIEDLPAMPFSKKPSRPPHSQVTSPTSGSDESSPMSPPVLSRSSTVRWSQRSMMTDCESLITSPVTAPPTISQAMLFRYSQHKPQVTSVEFFKPPPLPVAPHPIRTGATAMPMIHELEASTRPLTPPTDVSDESDMEGEDADAKTTDPDDKAHEASSSSSSSSSPMSPKTSDKALKRRSEPFVPSQPVAARGQRRSMYTRRGRLSIVPPLPVLPPTRTVSPIELPTPAPGSEDDAWESRKPRQRPMSAMRSSDLPPLIPPRDYRRSMMTLPRKANAAHGRRAAKDVPEVPSLIRRKPLPVRVAIQTPPKTPENDVDCENDKTPTNAGSMVQVREMQRDQEAPESKREQVAKAHEPEEETKDIKMLFVRGRYQECVAECEVVLDRVKEMYGVQPAYLIYHTFYLATSLEILSRAMDDTEETKQTHLQRALGLYQKVEAYIAMARIPEVEETPDDSDPSTAAATTQLFSSASSVRSSISSIFSHTSSAFTNDSGGNGHPASAVTMSPCPDSPTRENSHGSGSSGSVRGRRMVFSCPPPPRDASSTTATPSPATSIMSSLFGSPTSASPISPLTQVLRTAAPLRSLSKRLSFSLLNPLHETLVEKPSPVPSSTTTMTAAAAAASASVTVPRPVVTTTSGSSNNAIAIPTRAHTASNAPPLFMPSLDDFPVAPPSSASTPFSPTAASQNSPSTTVGTNAITSPVSQPGYPPTHHHHHQHSHQHEHQHQHHQHMIIPPRQSSQLPISHTLSAPAVAAHHAAQARYNLHLAQLGLEVSYHISSIIGVIDGLTDLGHAGVDIGQSPGQDEGHGQNAAGRGYPGKIDCYQEKRFEGDELRRADLKACAERVRRGSAWRAGGGMSIEMGGPAGGGAAAGGKAGAPNTTTMTTARGRGWSASTNVKEVVGAMPPVEEIREK